MLNKVLHNLLKSIIITAKHHSDSNYYKIHSITLITHRPNLKKSFLVSISNEARIDNHAPPKAIIMTVPESDRQDLQPTHNRRAQHRDSGPTRCSSTNGI